MTADYDELRRFAARIRIETINEMAAFGAGHIGGSVSVADALAVLYGGIMRVDPANQRWEDRDYLVMSKGHCGPALYAALALKGFFPTAWLSTLNRIGTRLPSHCDRNKTPGIDASTGSLGQGISIAAGFALAAKLKRHPRLVYAIVGDGELQEGQVWEAIEFAAHRQLDNLVVLVDKNGAQLDGRVEDICNPFDLEKKFEAFGCRALTVRGDRVEEIEPALRAIRDGEAPAGRPHVVILETVKGAGCLFAEKKFPNHHLTVSREDADAAIIEIKRRLEAGLLPGGGKRDV